MGWLGLLPSLTASLLKRRSLSFPKLLRKKLFFLAVGAAENILPLIYDNGSSKKKSLGIFFGRGERILSAQNSCVRTSAFPWDKKEELRGIKVWRCPCVRMSISTTRPTLSQLPRLKRWPIDGF